MGSDSPKEVSPSSNVIQWQPRGIPLVVSGGLPSLGNAGSHTIVAIEDAGIRTHVPLTDFAHWTDFSGQDYFDFGPKRDEDRCLQEVSPPSLFDEAHGKRGCVPWLDRCLQRLSGQGPVVYSKRCVGHSGGEIRPLWIAGNLLRIEVGATSALLVDRGSGGN